MGQRNLLSILFILVVAAAWVQIAPTEKQPKYPNITVHFENTDRVLALKEVARQMGLYIYVCPTVGGTVNVRIENEPWEAALDKLVHDDKQSLTYKVVGKNTLVVAAANRCYELCEELEGAPRCYMTPSLPEDAVRAEFLLDEVSAAKVVDFLKIEYINVQFEPHPVLNGFYATGSRKDLKDIRQEVETLDRLPSEPTPIESVVEVHHIDLDEATELLRTMVPDVQYRTDPTDRTLHLSGPYSGIEQVKELLRELDRPLKSTSTQ